MPNQLSPEELNQLRQRFEDEASEWFDVHVPNHRMGDSYNLPKLSSAWSWYQSGFFAGRVNQ